MKRIATWLKANRSFIAVFGIALIVKAATAPTQVQASYAPMSMIGKTRVAQKSGTLTNTGIAFCDTFSVSSATPTVSMSSYISAQGGTSFKLAAATGYRASATATNSPNVSVTGLSSNSATFIITQQNTSTVTILGINVLSGLPMVLVPDPTNVKLIISGYIY